MTCMTTEQKNTCRLSVEEGLRVLNDPVPDFSQFRDVLQPLIESSTYSSIICEMYTELISGTLHIVDAVELLEDIYEKLV